MKFTYIHAITDTETSLFHPYSKEMESAKTEIEPLYVIKSALSTTLFQQSAADIGLLYEKKNSFC